MHANKRRITLMAAMTGLLLWSTSGAWGVWNTFQTEHCRIFYQRDQDTARRLASLSEQSYRNATAVLGPIAPLPLIDVWLAESEDQFRRMVNGALQDWAVACAYPERRRIVVQRPGVFSAMNLNFDTIVQHEMVHVVFGQRVAPVLDTIPRWFAEGVAMAYSEGWSQTHWWRLAGSGLWRRLIPLEALRTDFPQVTAKAQLAYTESLAAVEYLRREHGEQTVRDLIERMARGRPFERAFFEVTGRTLKRFEEAFPRYVRRHYGWFPALFSAVSVWLLVSIIVLIGYRRRRRQKQRVLEEWAQQEAQVDPFFQEK